MTQLNESYFSFGDSKVFYQLAGEGSALVLSHAGFVDSRMWDDQWPVFTRSHRVLRYDLRGFGKSSAEVSPVNRRDDLFRLMRHLNLSSAVLIGCSMSGEIVLDFTLEHPEMVSALVLVSTVPAGFEMHGPPPPLLMQMFTALQQGDLDLAADLEMRLWIDGPARQPGQANPLVRQRAAEMSRIPLANHTFLKMDSERVDPLNPPASERLGEIHVPTLIIDGALDDPEILRAADVMAAGIPGAQKVVMNGCAHLPNMEQPAEFNHLVLDFLEGVK